MKSIGIDLGTSNTLVYVKGEGIVVNEPSVVAFNKKTGGIIAVGHKARSMQGKTPEHIEVSRPLVHGIIFDFEVTETMLSYFMSELKLGLLSFLARPLVIVGIPTNITEVEKSAVEDAAKSAGAGKVILIEEPLAAAIGAGMPVGESTGSLVCDIGGGTSEIGLISLGGLVVKKNLNVAGDALNQDIIEYVKNEHNLLIGPTTAEQIKMEIGSALPLGKKGIYAVSGRDLVKGLPREITLTEKEVREAMRHSLKTIAEAIKDVLNQVPPELAGDIIRNHIIVTGGGSLLKGLDKFLEQYVEMPVQIADDPLTTVVRGEGLILENFEEMKHLL
ncbi:MAG: rod shape-determining protein [Candidatus Portnoybacteria bacterium]|nr:rod shape-determining protein [Candidatus Portnoybacteria bacterium]